jgi:sugar/nucleoside kinase (ribokinase family)
MSGFFVGRSTFDLDFSVEAYPEEDTKIRADKLLTMAGGPGLNAAVVYAALGLPATLLSVVGSGRFADAVREDIGGFGVRFIDAAAGQPDVLPVSSVIVNPNKTTRTVVSSNPPVDIHAPGEEVWRTLEGSQVVLIDGHIPDLALAVIREASRRKIPVVMDGGNWRDVHGELLPFVDYAVVSEKFLPPGAKTADDVFDSLTEIGVEHIAITRGETPLSWRSAGQAGDITPPTVKSVDTLGAGDIFHGAFCWSLVEQGDFVTALETAAQVAAFSTTMWGTRSWIPAWLEKSRGA